MAQSVPSPAALLREGHVETPDFRLRYREGGPSHPVGTVVTLDSPTWDLGELHQALLPGYRVIALELGDLSDALPETSPRGARELAEGAARAVARLAPGQLTLIGASLGASVALWQALQAPGPVEALVLISPLAVGVTGDLPSQPDPLDPVGVSREQELLRQIQRDDPDAEARLGQVQCPTLVVLGSRDRIVSPEAARVYREKVPNCHVSLVYDAGHLLMADRPQALVSLVADYVERRETFIVGRQNTIINP